MKTIFLIRNISPDAYGGGESYQIALSQALISNGIEPIIISASSRLIEQARQNHIKIIIPPYNKHQNWSGWRNILLPIYIVWQFRLYFWYKKQIKTYNPVAIDIQSRDDMIAATLAGNRTKTRVLWTDHADFRVWVLQNINVKYKNVIGKYIIKLTSIPYKIIFISNFEEEWFKKNVKNLSNSIVVQNGVVDHQKSYKDITPIKNSFCYVGRIVESKGIFELVAAFNIISKKYSDAKLHIYGDGPDLSKCKELSSKNHSIIFHGYTDNPLKAIAQSEIFVLPSYHEGLSISLLEATMLQKVIVATGVDGNLEVIKNNKTGLTIPPKDTAALAYAIEKVIQDKSLSRRLSINARKNYEKNFNFSTTVRNKIIPIID